MLHIVLWKWTQPGVRRDPYTADHVNMMARMLKRNLGRESFRILCITDDPAGIDSNVEVIPLWDDHSNLANATKRHLPSCYRRLKLYDRATQKNLGIPRGDRIVGLDLDTLICGNVFRLFMTPGKFVGWELPGGKHPKVFNGSLQMFDAGDALQFIWSDFNPISSPKECFEAGWLGSDQSWLSMNLIAREGSVALAWPEVASYPLQIRIRGMLSAQTKVIFFHGAVKPWDPQALRDSSWVARYWR